MKDVLERVVCTCSNLKMDGWRSLPMTQSDVNNDDDVGRVAYEVTLTNSIRYANGDAVEQWLYDLLCLDVTDLPPLTGGTPDPASCDLYYVNRDTLFSYDRSAETFLKHLVNLYVSSHYKVSPSCV